MMRGVVPAETTLAQLRADLLARRYDVRTLEHHYAARIAAIDRSGPLLSAVIEVNQPSVHYACSRVRSGSAARSG